MFSVELDWAKLLDIVNLLAGPVITGVAVLAAVLLFRADNRLRTLCLLAGCALIFLQRVTHAIVLLPGLGYLDRLGHAAGGRIVAFNNFTVLLNLVAWLLFVSGLFMVALERFRASRAVVGSPASPAQRP